MYYNQEDLANSLITIDPEKFARNIKKVKDYLGDKTELMYTVKSMGYGHGLVEMADLALKTGIIHKLATATISEAVTLRKNGYQGFLMVLAGIHPKAFSALADLDIVSGCYDIFSAIQLNEEAKLKNKVLDVHIKIDSGMHRLGVTPGPELSALLETLKTLTFLKVKGCYTHLANADEADQIVTNRQLDLFDQGVEQIRKAGFSLEYIHSAGSDACIISKRSHYNLARPAALFYGYDTSEGVFNPLDLEPVLRWTSFITNIRHVKKGEAVGYSGFYRAKEDCIIAIGAFGASDGYLRSLVSKNPWENGHVLIKGQRAPIVAICMDQTLIEISHLKDVKLYDEIVILGRDQKEEISVYELKEKSKTTVGYILSTLSQRPLRLYRSF